MTYTPTEQAHLDLVRRMYAAENAHDPEAYGACLAPDLEVVANGRPLRSGRDAQAAHMRDETFAAFPDWRNETLTLLADGDHVVVRWRATGTHSAPLVGIPATGKRIEVFATSLFEFRGGLIRRHSFDIDTSWMQQLAAATKEAHA